MINLDNSEFDNITCSLYKAQHKMIPAIIEAKEVIIEIVQLPFGIVEMFCDCVEKYGSDFDIQDSSPALLVGDSYANISEESDDLA